MSLCCKLPSRLPFEDLSSLVIPRLRSSNPPETSLSATGLLDASDPSLNFGECTEPLLLPPSCVDDPYFDRARVWAVCGVDVSAVPGVYGDGVRLGSTCCIGG